MNSLRDVIDITNGVAVEERSDYLDVSEATVAHLRMTGNVFKDHLKKQQLSNTRLEREYNALMQSHENDAADHRRASRELTTLQKELLDRNEP
jgi:hypothetical protein